MRLTKIQKTILGNRYWQKNETFQNAKRRKGFASLTYAQFLAAVDSVSPYIKKKRTISYSLLWLDKPDDKAEYFRNISEAELLESRKGLPIPEETKEIFRTGRLAAYYNNPI